MKLIPFNLEKALAGAEVRTGDGGAVKRLVYLPEAFSRKLVAVLDDGTVFCYHVDGRPAIQQFVYEPEKLKLCLVEEEPKRFLWVNIWKNADPAGVIYANVHLTAEAAEAERLSSCSGKTKLLLSRVVTEYPQQ